MKFLRIKPLGIKAEKVSSIFGMITGFMFSDSKVPKLFIFPKELYADIHMLFVFKPLVIVWINKHKKIVAFSKAKPFLFYKVHKANYVLEIPDLKVIKKLRKGMKLRF